MTSPAVDGILAAALTGLQTATSTLIANETGWRRWVPGFVMLTAFVPLLRAEAPPLVVRPPLLCAAGLLWGVVMVVRPGRAIWIRRLAVVACGGCLALLNLP